MWLAEGYLSLLLGVLGLGLVCFGIGIATMREVTWKKKSLNIVVGLILLLAGAAVFTAGAYVTGN